MATLRSIVLVELDGGYAPQRGEATGLEVYSWYDETVPNLLAYDLIVAEVPQGPHPLLQEIEQARMAGAHVVWLAEPSSSLEVLEGILGTPVHVLRSNAPGSVFEVMEKSLAPYFELVSRYYFTFTPEAGWVPLAQVRSPQLAIAALKYDGDHQQGGSLLLPGSERDDLSLLAAAIAEIWPHLSRNLSPELRLKRSLLRVAATAAVLLLFVVLARYSQRQENRVDLQQFAEYQGVESVFWRTHLAGALHSAPWDEPKALSAIILEEAEASDLQNTLQMLRRLNYHGTHLRLLREIYQRGGSEASWRRDIADNELREILWVAEQEVRAGRFEIARFHAQRFLNLAYTVTSDDFLEYNNLRLNSAQQIIDLTRPNFAYGSEAAVREMVDIMERWRASPQMPLSITEDTSLDPTLLDNLAYAQATIQAHEFPADAEATWREFLSLYPASEKVEEAYFNIIRSDYWKVVFREATGEPKPVAAVYSSIDDFVERFPRSYLADDALYFKVMLAVEEAQPRTAGRALQHLVETYPAADSTRRLLRNLRLRAYTVTGRMEVAAPLTDALVREARRAPATEYGALVDNLFEQLGGRLNQPEQVSRILSRMANQPSAQALAGQPALEVLGRAVAGSVDRPWVLRTGDSEEDA